VGVWSNVGEQGEAGHGELVGVPTGCCGGVRKIGWSSGTA